MKTFCGGKTIIRLVMGFLLTWSSVYTTSIQRHTELDSAKQRRAKRTTPGYELNLDNQTIRIRSCDPSLLSCADRGCDEIRSPEGAKCLCHPICLYTGSCCFDYTQLCSAATGNTSTVGGDTRVMQNPVPSVRKRTRCELIDGHTYQYVVSCPSDWEIDSVRQLCEVGMEKMYTEQLIQARDTTYLNIYCAICNRENSSYISYWPHVQKCALANNSSVDINNLTHFSNISDIKALLEREGQCCRYITAPDDVRPSHCAADVCSCSSFDSSWPCGSYKLDVFNFNAKFSNPHCYYCTNFSSILEGPLSCNKYSQHLAAEASLGSLGEVKILLLIAFDTFPMQTTHLVGPDDRFTNQEFASSAVCRDCGPTSPIYVEMKFVLCGRMHQNPCDAENLYNLEGDVVLRRLPSLHGLSVIAYREKIAYGITCVDDMVMMCKLPAGFLTNDGPVTTVAASISKNSPTTYFQRLYVSKPITTLLIGVESSATLIDLVGVVWILSLVLSPSMRVARSPITKVLISLLVLSGIVCVTMFYLPFGVRSSNSTMCLVFGMLQHYLSLALFVSMAAFSVVLPSEFIKVAPSSSARSHLIAIYLSLIFPVIVISVALIYWKVSVAPEMTFGKILLDIYAMNGSCFATDEHNMKNIYLIYPVLGLALLTSVSCVISVFVIRYKSEHTVEALKMKLAKGRFSVATFLTLFLINSSYWLTCSVDSVFTADINNSSFWWLYSGFAYVRGTLLLSICTIKCLHNRANK